MILNNFNNLIKLGSDRVGSNFKKSGTGRVGSKRLPKLSGRVRVGYLGYLLRVGSNSGRVITRSIPNTDAYAQNAQFQI